MLEPVQKITYPELVFGFVAPIGADLKPAIVAFRREFERRGYKVIEIKVTDVFEVFRNYVAPEDPLIKGDEYRRYVTHIAYGNQLRQKFGDDVLAAVTVRRLMRKRIRHSDAEKYSQIVYLIPQFKRKEEIDLLRSVYGKQFFQVSIYSRKGARVDYLSRIFGGQSSSSPQQHRANAEKLALEDENEVAQTHGQRVAKVFHDADFIVNLDILKPSTERQIERFINLIFGANFESPSRSEYGLFLAKAAALRTLDLSRQVGAAIFTPFGEIIALGSNEVPKAGGGTHWTDEDYDDRDYTRNVDSNVKRKKEILTELAKIIAPQTPADDVLQNQQVLDSQFMDALEYGRIVHAEMSALMDAARVGHSVNKGTLYCTTFPCHMCAKHIVSAGISKVIFLEPYPKSLASDFHSDSICVEGGDRGHYQKYPSVEFEHFYGVTPRRYREIFERGGRKNADGSFRKYLDDIPSPIVDIKLPLYAKLEEYLTVGSYNQIVECTNREEIEDS